MRLAIALASTLASTAILAACATPQENPFYQYSSTYTPDRGETVQSASYQLPERDAAPIRQPVEDYQPVEGYSRVAPGCWETESCAPVAVAETEPPRVSAPWTSPTEDAFGGESTPGAQAVAGLLGEELAGAPPQLSYQLQDDPEPAPSPTPFTYREAERADTAGPMPRPEPRDGTTLTISGPIHQALSGTQTRALMHRVEAGDTVYSLARRYCTDVTSVQELNGLDAGYGISVGQDLKLPANCE